jgi:hypothetical protein
MGKERAGDEQKEEKEPMRYGKGRQRNEREETTLRFLVGFVVIADILLIYTII